MSNKPESVLHDKLQFFKAVNRPISFGIGPSQSQIRMRGSGDVHQSYLPIGSHPNKDVVTNPNFQSPSGFDLHQSECIIHGHHW
jgi:hypothetical protein